MKASFGNEGGQDELDSINKSIALNKQAIAEQRTAK
jgi:hypothetical protein